MRHVCTKNSFILPVLFLFINLIPVFPDTKWDIDADIVFGSNNKIVEIDYYLLQADLTFSCEFMDYFTAIIGLDTDRFDVSIKEISLAWEQFPYIGFIAGKFENALTLDEYRPARKRLFGTKSIISDYISLLGYINSNTGIMGYKEYNKKTAPVSYFFHGSFNGAATEVQCDLGFFYHFYKKEHYLGLMAGYIPFLRHDFWLREDVVSETHNILLDLVYTNYENPFVYGLELTWGSNIIDPIGIIHIPGAEDRSFFAGGDLQMGYTFDFGEWKLVPCLRVSTLIPEITIPECQQIEIIYGTEFTIKDIWFLHGDAGIGINTLYGDDQQLYTRLEVLWAFTARINL